MSYSTKVNTVVHDAAHILKEPDIQRKDDYSCIQCQKENVINPETNAKRFWRFYHIAFKPAYQSNAITRQAFTLLVNIVTKEVPAEVDEEYAERIAF